MEWELAKAILDVAVFVALVGVATVVVTVAAAYAFGWLA